VHDLWDNAGMTIDGKTRVIGVIGDPITGVRSPEWFNELFARQEINAVVVPMAVTAGDLESAFAGLKRIGNLDALIVTMPHKGRMSALLDALGPAAQTLGSVNAVRRMPDGRWMGDMFDGRGCVEGLREKGHDVSGRSVFVLGVGAAGSAVAFAMAEAGTKTLVLDDLNRSRVDAVAQRIQAAYPATHVMARPIELQADYDFAVNCTPLGMKSDDPLPFDPEVLPASTVVVDIITKPEVTPLLERAQATGHRIHAGKHMHAAQAVEAAKFLGFDPSK
jgi:shikimate dehydrogenase